MFYLPAPEFTPAYKNLKFQKASWEDKQEVPGELHHYPTPKRPLLPSYIRSCHCHVVHPAHCQLPRDHLRLDSHIHLRMQSYHYPDEI